MQSLSAGEKSAWADSGEQKGTGGGAGGKAAIPNSFHSIYMYKTCRWAQVSLDYFPHAFIEMSCELVASHQAQMYVFCTINDILAC